MTIKFQNPPINELIITTYFNPPISNLRNEHIGIFWSQIKDDFPKSSQQVPIGSGETAIMDVENEISPMPRYWFISKDETNLLQIQKNAFMFNWRKGNDSYPRFNEHLKPSFDRYFSRFSEFLRIHADTPELTIDLCQLSYINVIRRCEFWSGPEDTQNIIPSLSVPNPRIAFTNPPSFNCTYMFEMSHDLQLVLSTRNVVVSQNPDEHEPLLIIEIHANGRLGKASKQQTDSWFDHAHEAVNKCFIEVTDQQIQQRHWKPKEENL